jgi:hypothetical protein
VNAIACSWRSRVDVLQPPQAAHQQHGADDEHDRQRHLGGDQQVAQPRVSRDADSLRSVTARCATAERRHDAEDDRRASDSASAKNSTVRSVCTTANSGMADAA